MCACVCVRILCGARESNGLCLLSVVVHVHLHLYIDIYTHTHIHTGVFQPGYNLPTMSLDEYAQQQMAEAQARTNAQTHAQAEGGGPPRRYKQLEEEGKEDDEGLVEEAVYADRAWDAFKDDHPFGSGNKAGKLF